MESHYVCIAKYIVAAMNKRKLNLYNWEKKKSVSFNYIQARISNYNLVMHYMLNLK